MTNISWEAFTDSTPDSYNVYRSITGVVINFPNSLATGDLFIFQTNSKELQRLTVAATDIDSIAALINTAEGLKAIKDSGGTKLLVRRTSKSNPRLKIQPCSFAAHAGISSGVYSEKQAFALIGNVPFVSGQVPYSFEDLDGYPLDWYHVVAVTGSSQSIPSIDRQALIAPPDLCTIEGRVSDIENNSIVGALVDARVQIPDGVVDNSGIAITNVQTLTDSLGRWSLPLIRGQLVLFQIEAIGYNEVLSIPDAPFALFKDLKPVDDYLFAPGGDPLAGI